MVKVDIELAYYFTITHHDDCCLLGVEWEDWEDWEDCNHKLLFSLRSVPKIFNAIIMVWSRAFIN